MVVVFRFFCCLFLKLSTPTYANIEGPSAEDSLVPVPQMLKVEGRVQKSKMMGLLWDGGQPSVLADAGLAAHFITTVLPASRLPVKAFWWLVLTFGISDSRSFEELSGGVDRLRVCMGAYQCVYQSVYPCSMSPAEVRGKL